MIVIWNFEVVRTYSGVESVGISAVNLAAHVSRLCELSYLCE